MGQYQQVLWQEDDEITSEKLQQMADNETFLRSSFFSFVDVSNTLVGGTPDFSNIKLQGGTDVTQTNGAGGFAINYPIPFPTGLITVVPIGGDIIAPFPTGMNITLIADQTTILSSFGGVAQRPDGTGIEGLIRINWLAAGW